MELIKDKSIQVNIMIKIILMMLLLICSGCEHKENNHIISKKNSQYHSDPFFQDYNNVGLFYSYYDNKYRKILKKSKSDLTKDTVYFCYNQGGMNSSMTTLYTIDSEKVINVGKDEHFLNYIDRTKKYFNWDKINSNNINTFFATLMFGYHYYADFPNMIINSFPTFFIKLHQMSYCLTDSCVTIKFRFFDRVEERTITVNLFYNKINDIMRLDTLSSFQTKVRYEE
jgi:hypothetical protein